MLSSQEATIECQKDEVQKLKELLSERTSQLSVKEESFQRTTEELESLKLGNGPSGNTRLHNTVMIMLTDQAMYFMIPSMMLCLISGSL